MSKYAFTYQGIEFKSKNQLFKLLGYTQSMSDSMIQKQYKTLDNLVRVRLRLKQNEDIKDALLLLLKQQDQPKNKNTVLQPKELSELSNEQQCAKKYAQALLNKGDEQILNSLLLAFGCENEQGRESVLKYFDEIKKGV